jgi:hypothetical protein
MVPTSLSPPTPTPASIARQPRLEPRRRQPRIDFDFASNSAELRLRPRTAPRTPPNFDFADFDRASTSISPTSTPPNFDFADFDRADRASTPRLDSADGDRASTSISPTSRLRRTSTSPTSTAPRFRRLRPHLDFDADADFDRAPTPTSPTPGLRRLRLRL